jgi:hypothetical protein
MSGRILLYLDRSTSFCIRSKASLSPQPISLLSLHLNKETFVCLCVVHLDKGTHPVCCCLFLFFERAWASRGASLIRNREFPTKIDREAPKLCTSSRDPSGFWEHLPHIAARYIHSILIRSSISKYQEKWIRKCHHQHCEIPLQAIYRNYRCVENPRKQNQSCSPRKLSRQELWALLPL